MKTQGYIYTTAGKAKLVPVFKTEREALLAFAKKLRDKTSHKVFIIRWREIREVDLLPARGGTRHALMDGIRIRVQTWYDTRAAARRILVRDLRYRAQQARGNLRQAERELQKAARA